MKLAFALALSSVLFSSPALSVVALSEHQKLFASHPIEQDAFGGGVAVDGDTAIVQSRGAQNDWPNTGSIHVFTRDVHGMWDQLQEIAPSDGGENNSFGEVIVLDGDAAMIRGSSGVEGGPRTSVVFVLARDSTGFWSEVQKLVPAPVEQVVQDFGRAMALQGNTAIIGAPSYDGQSGAAWVFMRDDSYLWTEKQFIEGPVKGGPCPSDPCGGEGPGFFGDAIGLDGDTAVIGAPFEDLNGGGAYVYTRDATGTWNQGQRVFAAEGRGKDVFGSAVAVDGDTAIIGAFQDDEFPGAAYVFRHQGEGVWVEIQKLVASDATNSTRFGQSIAMDGGTAVITGFSGSNKGYVVKEDPGGVWAEEAQLIASDGGFGAMDFDGNTTMGGRRNDATHGVFAGAAYVFLVPRAVALNFIAPFNHRSHGVLPVTILSSDDFDASSVDVATLSLGPGGARPAHHGHLSDTNSDGLADLLVHFWTAATEISCADEMVSLTGKTLFDQPIEGHALIRHVGCR